MKMRVNRLLLGIKNILHYGPTIYQDRQWDYWYLIKLMQKKMDLLSKYDFPYVEEKHIKRERQRIALATRLLRVEAPLEPMDPALHRARFNRLVKKYGGKRALFLMNDEYFTHAIAIAFRLIGRNITKWWD